MKMLSEYRERLFEKIMKNALSDTPSLTTVEDFLKNFALEAIKEDRKHVAEYANIVDIKCLDVSGQEWDCTIVDKYSIINAPMIELI